MTIKNDKELERALKKDLRKAMQFGADKVLADMFESAGEFYTDTEPKMYERTGALANTPNTTGLSDEGNGYSFDAYFDDKGSYTTGKNPSMHDVLDLADKGITNSSVGKLRPAVGNMGFVDNADKKIEKTMDETLGKFFNKA